MLQADVVAAVDSSMTDVSVAAASYVVPKQPRTIITPPRHFMTVQMSATTTLRPAPSRYPCNGPLPDHSPAEQSPHSGGSAIVRCAVCVSSFSPALETVTGLIFRAVLTESVKSLFGVVGAGLYCIDVLTFDASTATGIIAIDSSHVVPIRSAFALCGGTEGGRQCHIRVVQSSAFLTSLAVDSRRWQQQLAGS